MPIVSFYILGPNAVLVQTGKQIAVENLHTHEQQIGVESLRTGRQHATLQRAAEAQAAYQARVGEQGHQNWKQRVKVLMRQMPQCSEFREACNESWPDQNVKDAALEMYKSWKESPGHWSAVNGPCTFYGYAMVRGSNGVWYACGIFCDARNLK